MNFNEILQKAMRMDRSGGRAAAETYLQDEFAELGITRNIADGMAKDILDGYVYKTKSLLRKALADPNTDEVVPHTFGKNLHPGSMSSDGQTMNVTKRKETKLEEPKEEPDKAPGRIDGPVTDVKVPEDKMQKASPVDNDDGNPLAEEYPRSDVTMEDPDMDMSPEKREKAEEFGRMLAEAFGDEDEEESEEAMGEEKTPASGSYVGNPHETVPPPPAEKKTFEAMTKALKNSRFERLDRSTKVKKAFRKGRFG